MKNKTAMNDPIKPQQPTITPGIYRHYKGNDYQVLGLVRHSETEEYLVLYKTLYGDYSSWVRPYSMFVDEVEVDGHKQPRFRLQEATEEVQPLLKVAPEDPL
tara:strand:- start:25059 stop:25364 length:306 start_codon:yes stop_codon:yes gene_type:complete